jgi:dienelactone hydrolase
MLTRLFHAWERRLAAVSTDRVVRPFEWGTDWIPPNGHHATASPLDRLRTFAAEALSDSDRFYALDACDDYRLSAGLLAFPSAVVTPHPENNIVRARLFRSRGRRASPRRAVLVLPQWNADPGGHAGLCRWLAHEGITALRLSLPYHDERRPSELTRADYIVSANVGRTLQICRQAVLDARRAIAWLAREGFERIGILGTSLGSCLSMLTAAHEPLVRAAALNHVSPYFADVVWHGLSTAHVRAGLDGRIDLDALRELWLPISPHPFLHRMHGKATLLVYARYDLTFPVPLSQALVQGFEQAGVAHEVVALRCGHYTTGVTPFKWIDGYTLVRFLKRSL